MNEKKIIAPEPKELITPKHRQQFSEDAQGNKKRKQIYDVQGNIRLTVPVRNAVPLLANMVVARYVNGDNENIGEIINKVLDEVIDYEIDKEPKFILAQTILQSIENM